MSEYFTKEEFTTPIKRRFHEFPAALNGTTKTVRIQSLTALERSRYELSNLNSKGLWNPDDSAKMDCRLVSLCVVDQDGQRMLTEADVQSLLDQDGGFIKQIFDECYEHVGLQSLSVRRLAKNSESVGETETVAD